MIIWDTPVGSLGTVKEQEYFSLPLSATDNQGDTVEYTHIAGTMPPGTQVLKEGFIKGIPVITVETKAKTVTYTFTVRANNPSGDVADRSFSISVNNFSSLKISPKVYIRTLFDNSYVDEQFEAVTENPNARLTWRVLEGNYPYDARTNKPIPIDSMGRYFGWLRRDTVNVAGQSGYSIEDYSDYPYDFSQVSSDKLYNFQVQVSDGVNTDNASVTLVVKSSNALSCDTDTSISAAATVGYEWTCDLSSGYPPVPITDASNIPVLPVGTKFAYKFEAVDQVGEPIYWEANSYISTTGLTVNELSGWMSGTIADQVEEQKTTHFTVYPYKLVNGTIKVLGKAIDVDLTTIKDPTNYVVWNNTNANLGVIVNGATSEFAVSASHIGGRPVVYDVVAGSLPYGLKLQPEDGLITGRASFQYFALDGQFSNITVANTTGISTGMIVQGPGVASGSAVTWVGSDNNSLTIEPGLYIQEGVEVTFSNLTRTVITTITDQSTTTRIDRGDTTFDRVFTANIKASTTTGNIVTNTQQFTFTVSSYNAAPYLNVWTKALVPVDQRNLFNAVINNIEYFPPNLIYRSSDKWFGKAQGINSLFLPGVAPITTEEFFNAIERNHYVKTLRFGEIKTARAVDDNFDTKYEVVYVELIDDKSINGVSTPLEITPTNKNAYIYSNTEYTTIYPNSFENMQYRIDSGVGFTNRGALPDWMLGPQEDGSVLGMTRCVVLAYTVPGASKLIQYRLKSAGVNFNNIFFQTDRYNADYGMLDNYDLGNNQFYSNTTIISGNIVGNVLNVTGVYARSNAQATGNAIVSSNVGNIRVGQYVSGIGVDNGTVVTEFITGTGSTGSYYVNRSQDVSGNLMLVTQKDTYLAPADRDKYIIFPQIGVYK